MRFISERRLVFSETPIGKQDSPSAREKERSDEVRPSIAIQHPGRHYLTLQAVENELVAGVSLHNASLSGRCSRDMFSDVSQVILIIRLQKLRLNGVCLSSERH